MNNIDNSVSSFSHLFSFGHMTTNIVQTIDPIIEHISTEIDFVTGVMLGVIAVSVVTIIGIGLSLLIEKIKEM